MWRWISMGLSGVLALAGTLAAITPEEHARRIARMQEIAAQSHGKIEIMVEAYDRVPAAGHDALPEARPETALHHTLAGNERATPERISTPLPAPVEAADVTDRRELLPRALHLIYRKHDEEALAILQYLLHTWPASEPSRLWHYWAGECCYHLNRMDTAAKYFLFAAESDNRDKAEQATLKLALIADARDDRVNGKRLLAKLLHDYPHGDGVLIAKPLLEKYGLI